ncbi:MAG: DegV family protein [Lachnospiraceae bacterium]|nr:DegV family protein [Lachnospiraceae bacterium]MDD3794863.1 DegV family protein [Lachnospiraceae bacterium]
MFEIFVDSAANLPAEQVKKYGIRVISFVNFVNGKEMINFDGGLTPEEERVRGKEYYDAMRADVEIKTSLINASDFIDHFEAVLKEGKDILYISLSKNISGTFNASKLAAEELKENYPERKIMLVDSLNASLAQGILAIYAYEMRGKGHPLEQIADVLGRTAYSMNGTFTVGNLRYLARTGRIHKATATVGNLLSIKPILRGNKEGFIVQFGSCRGRKKSLNTLVDLVCSNIVEPEKQIIGIAQADAYEDSLYVVEQIRNRVKVRDFINTSYDYCTGSHVGPDTIAVFFIGYDRELQGSPSEPDYKPQQIFDMIG